MTLLIGFFLLSIVFSFLCSVWEAVLLSVTPSYIKGKQKDDPTTGNLLHELKKDVDKPLSAILTLNTIAHTVGAIGVGAQAGKLFGSKSIDLFGLGLTYESVIATLMTLGILFLSEIIPKTIGANNWKSLAPITARSVQALVWLLTPFVWLSTQLTKLLKKDKNKSVFSKRDFAAMAELINESGGIENDDYTLIRNVLQFDNLLAKDVMTPRTVMVMARENQTLMEFYNSNKPFRFSRVPLYDGTSDKVTGILLKSDMLEGIIEGKSEVMLKDVKREVSFVSHDTPLRKVFETLSSQREHLAVVADEYGGIIGLLTIEDIFETLFGLEIMDETDAVSDLQSYARKKWKERAIKIGLIEENEVDTLP